VNQTESSVAADVGRSQYTPVRHNRHLKIRNKLGSDVIATRSFQALHFVVYAKSKTLLSHRSSLFSNATQHGLVVNYRRFGTTNRFQIRGSGSIILLGVFEP